MVVDVNNTELSVMGYIVWYNATVGMPGYNTIMVESYIFLFNYTMVDQALSLI